VFQVIFMYLDGRKKTQYGLLNWFRPPESERLQATASAAMTWSPKGFVRTNVLELRELTKLALLPATFEHIPTEQSRRTLVFVENADVFVELGKHLDLFALLEQFKIRRNYNVQEKLEWTSEGIDKLKERLKHLQSMSVLRYKDEENISLPMTAFLRKLDPKELTSVQLQRLETEPIRRNQHLAPVPSVKTSQQAPIKVVPSSKKKVDDEEETPLVANRKRKAPDAAKSLALARRRRTASPVIPVAKTTPSKVRKNDMLASLPKTGGKSMPLKELNSTPPKEINKTQLVPLLSSKDKRAEMEEFDSNEGVDVESTEMTALPEVEPLRRKLVVEQNKGETSLLSKQSTRSVLQGPFFPRIDWLVPWLDAFPSQRLQELQPHELAQVSVLMMNFVAEISAIKK